MDNTRIAMAKHLGYVDAKFMAYMHETHGMHVIDQVVHLRSKGNRLKVDWSGLQVEFRRMGMKDSAVTVLLNEAAQYD